MRQKILAILVILTITLLGLGFRLWHIEFGLPHSFYADEPELVEPAIKYTYEIESIIGNGNWYKMIPISYVYGTFPVYFLTFLTMVFSKTLGLLHVGFGKEHIYIFLRTISALVSFFVAPLGAYLFYKLSKNKIGSLFTFALLALNWKFIVHSHYVNADSFISTLLCASFLTLLVYFQKQKDTLFTVLTGIFYGLAVGTKITVLITLPLYLYIFINKKDYRGLFGFIFIIFGTFMLTNPFSIIFANNFAYRIYEMMFKEGGMVFDSVDYSPFKYVLAVASICGLPVILLFLYSKYLVLKNKQIELKPYHIFLFGNILIYLLFYSIQSRRVDRWMLPIISIFIIYASNSLILLKSKLSKLIWVILISVIFGVYLIKPVQLLLQFQKNTPRSAAYIWAQQNLPVYSNKLVITEEGLDPFGKLPGSRVYKFQVYTSEIAQFALPEDALGYDYVILSSRPMSFFKNKEVKKAYPWYFEKWNAFEQSVINSQNFELIKDFSLSKPNLIPLSDVYVYKRL